MKFGWLVLGAALLGSMISLAYFALNSPVNVGESTGKLISIETIVISHDKGGGTERAYAEIRLENDQIINIWLPGTLRPDLGATIPLVVARSKLSGEIHYRLNVDRYNDEI